MGSDAIAAMARQRRELCERLRFFDAGIWLGRPQGFPLAEELHLDSLPTQLAGRTLAGGLVSHWRGKVVSASDGNRALCEADRSLGPDLFTVWTGLPLFPTEAHGPLPGRDELPERARAVRLFPKSHNFPLESWAIGPLCEWLSARRMPLFVWHVELDWPALHRLAGEFPDLPIVVETQTQKILYHTRALFPLMRDRRNVHVELSNFAGAGFIEYAVSQFGAERLIFGSFLPVSDPLVPIGMVLDADIAEKEKRLIAGDNLRQLIGEVRLLPESSVETARAGRAPAGASGPPGPAIAGVSSGPSASAASPQGTGVTPDAEVTPGPFGLIDAHMHVGPPAPFHAPATDLIAYLACMDSLGIAAAICSDTPSVLEGCTDGLAGHRGMFEQSGGRVHYLGTFHPGRSAACLAALEEARSWPGFAGLKIHPSIHGVPAEDPAYEPAWRFAAENELPILAHSWSASDYNPVQQLSTPERFEVWVEQFPTVPFVLGHAGGRGSGRHEAVRMACAHDNVFLDISGDIFDYRLIEGLAASVPLEKVLFGSDYPWLDPRSRLSHALLADVDQPIVAAILRENALSVYSRLQIPESGGP